MPDSFPFMSNFSTDTAGEINAIAKNLRGRVPDADIHASRAIARGDSVEAFRSEMISMMPHVQPMQKPMMADVKPKEWARYSLSSAVRGIVSGGGISGFEREMSDEVARRGGKSPEGFWVPGEVLNRSFVAGTASLGGDLVQTSNLGSEFIELLRNRPMCEQLGARVLNLNGPCTIPRQAGAGTANWLGETVASTLSVGNFTQVTLTPTAVSAFQQYSKQLAITSAPGIEQLILSDINSIINLAVDRACLHGSGSGEPTGIANTAGISTVSVAMLAASALSTSLHPFLVSLETTVATNNADLGALAYLVNPKMRAAAKATTKFSAAGAPPVWEPGDKLNSYRAAVTNQIATNLTVGTATTICSAVFYGNWADVLIASYNGGAADIVIDPFTLAHNGVVRICARKWVDVALRHPASFCLGLGVLA